MKFRVPPKDAFPKECSDRSNVELMSTLPKLWVELTDKDLRLWTNFRVEGVTRSSMLWKKSPNMRTILRSLGPNLEKR